MAIANANYEIIYCNFGTNGRISDGGILKNTKCYEKCMSGTLNVPEPQQVDYSERTLPYVFVGENLLKPFAKKHLSKEKEILIIDCHELVV